jgi:hypothetical protein
MSCHEVSCDVLLLIDGILLIDGTIIEIESGLPYQIN